MTSIVYLRIYSSSVDWRRACAEMADRIRILDANIVTSLHNYVGNGNLVIQLACSSFLFVWVLDICQNSFFNISSCCMGLLFWRRLKVLLTVLLLSLVLFQIRCELSGPRIRSLCDAAHQVYIIVPYARHSVLDGLKFSLWIYRLFSLDRGCILCILHILLLLLLVIFNNFIWVRLSSRPCAKTANCKLLLGYLFTTACCSQAWLFFLSHILDETIIWALWSAWLLILIHAFLWGIAVCRPLCKVKYLTLA